MGKSYSQLVDEINAAEPDDYSDWSLNELQELALFLGIDICTEEDKQNG